MDLLETFKTLSLTQIDDMISSKKEETLQLEFKTVSSPDFSKRDDRRTLAIALSGFANSVGGLIIWGVNARKNSEEIDCALSSVEIPSIPLFVSRLNELTGEAISPRLDGIIHKGIIRQNTNGFAITYVPESDLGPYMAKLGEDRYYKRSGSSFYKMEHFDVADMFGRRQRAKLAVETRIEGKYPNITIILSLHNVGRGSALAPYIAFSCYPLYPDIYGVDGNRNEGLRRLPHRGIDLPFRYGNDANYIIHPGISQDITSLRLSIRHKDLPLQQDVKIEYQVCAEGVPLEVGIITITKEQLIFSE